MPVARENAPAAHATLARVLSFCFKDGKTTITEDCEKEIVTLADYVTDDDEEERKDEQIIKKTLSSLAKSLVNMVKLDCSLKFLLFKSFLCRSLQGNMAKVSRYWPIVKSCANFSLLILDFFLGLQFELFFRIHGWLFFWWHYCNVYILPVQIAYL